MQKINQLVSELARAREVEEQLEDEVAAIEAEVAEMVAARYGQILDQKHEALETAKSDRLQAEVHLRHAALEAYEFDGTKKPHPSVEIRVYTNLVYDKGAALKFCTTLGKFLKLDAKAFEKAAPHLDLDFVEQRDDPRTFISKELIVLAPEVKS